MQLIATWNTDQDVAAENPIRLRWEDGTPATMEDFARIDTRTQSDPDIEGDIVEFGYSIA